jgi:5'-nucleotidase
VSAGQYGYNLNQLTFSVDQGTGHPVSVAGSILPLTTSTTSGTPPTTVITPNYTADPTVKQIVDEAVAQSDVLGAQPLGDIGGPFNRARVSQNDAQGVPQLVENRGGESTLGNVVAEAQRWATRSATTGAAQIAFMNPGGLRADMRGDAANGYPAVLTYKQAATVQPFANTLVNEQLTGDQIRQALEQQWQPAGSSRPFLRLGTSNGFRYTYDPAAAAGEHIKAMWLNGHRIDLAASYSVTVNSFLASGGDNFGALGAGTPKQDTGQTDLQAMVDFMAAFADSAPLAVDSRQHAVGVTWPVAAPAAYRPGDPVTFDVSSLAFTGANDKTDSEITVSAGDVTLGTFPVDNTIGTGKFDEVGTASVSFTVPQGVANGAQQLTITGLTTGTVVTVPVEFDAPKTVASVSASVAPDHVVVDRTKPRIKVSVRAGDAPAAGKVNVFVNGHAYEATLNNGKATVTLPSFRTTGKKEIRVKYLGNDSTKQASTTVKFWVRSR